MSTPIRPLDFFRQMVTVALSGTDEPATVVISLVDHDDLTVEGFDTEAMAGIGIAYTVNLIKIVAKVTDQDPADVWARLMLKEIEGGINQ